MAEMTCKQIGHCLADFVDGELAPDLDATVKRHLAGCNFCQELLSSYLKTIFILKRVHDIEPPPDAVQRLRRYLNTKLNL